MKTFNRIDGTKSKVVISSSIRRISDDSPDTSWLGEYSNSPKAFAIDRDQVSFGGVRNHREYQYFNPASVDKTLSDRENRRCAKWSYDRMEALNRGEWYFIGIKAYASFTIGDVIQTVSSGGLWGIESDSDESYLVTVERDEYDSLVEILKELGVTGLPSFKKIERKG